MNFYIIICNFIIKISVLFRSCVVILFLNNYIVLVENERWWMFVYVCDIYVYVGRRGLW